MVSKKRLDAVGRRCWGALTTGTESNVGVVERSPTVESPLGEGDIVLVPHFNVAALGDEVMVELGLCGAMLVFAREAVTVRSERVRDEGEGEKCESRLHRTR